MIEKLDNIIFHKIHHILQDNDKAIIDIYNNKLYIMATDMRQMYFYEKLISIKKSKMKFCMSKNMIDNLLDKEVKLEYLEDDFFINGNLLERIDYVNWQEKITIISKPIDGRQIDVKGFLNLAKNDKVEFDFTTGDIIIRKEFRLNLKHKIKGCKIGKFNIKNIAKMLRLFQTAYIYQHHNDLGNLLVIYKNGKKDRHVYMTL